MQRHVTAKDLKNYPELIKQGLQVNQLHDFTMLEASDSVADTTSDAAPASNTIEPTPEKPADRNAVKKAPVKKAVAKKAETKHTKKKK